MTKNKFGMSAGELGAYGELQACVWLLERGYEVYRNVTPNGKFDIIAIKDNEIRKIDVTRIPENCPKYVNRAKHRMCKDHGGNVLYVMPDASCKFDYEHDDIYDKIKYNCQYCGNDFEAYEKHRVTCGDRKCTYQHQLKSNNARYNNNTIPEA